MAGDVTVRKIVSRWDETKTLWEGPAESTRQAVEKAVEAGADLTGADLRGADLRGADLTDAVLRGADLRNAVLTDADLRGADLRNAVLTDADLRGADLTGADLTDAVLRGADLTGADLTGADLTGADLTPVRDDLFAVLSAAPAEAEALLSALRAGKVDGSCYTGECACLVGTIANARHVPYTDLGPLLQPNGSRPIERFFLAINEGDTPETNLVSKLAAEWTSDWLDRMRAAFGPQEVTTA